MFLAGGISAQGATIIWTNAAGGNWSMAANWSPNQTPGSADTAVITNAGNYTVTLDVSTPIAGLVLGTTSGANTQTLLVNGQTLTVNGHATVNSDGQFNFNSGALAGKCILAGALNWSGGEVNGGSSLTMASNGVLNIEGNVNIEGPLTNYGTVNWQAGKVEVYNDADTSFGVIWNQSGAQWNIQCDQAMQGEFGGELFNNAGTVLKTAGTNTTTMQVDFNDSGMVNVQSGTISLAGSYSLTNGTLDFGIRGASNYGKISLSGAALGTASLGVNLNGLYWPPVGSSFNLLTYTSDTGELFTNTALPPFITWQTNYDPTAFTLTVVARQTNATPTNLTMSLAGNSDLNLAWPGDHTGWQLETQTNPLAVGIGANWVIVPGSDLTNQMTVPIGLTNGAAFFRLMYP